MYTKGSGWGKEENHRSNHSVENDETNGQRYEFPQEGGLKDRAKEGH